MNPAGAAPEAPRPKPPPRLGKILWTIYLVLGILGTAWLFIAVLTTSRELRSAGR